MTCNTLPYKIAAMREAHRMWQYALGSISSIWRSRAAARRGRGASAPPLPGSAWLLQKLGITTGRRSVYDHIMLQLRDAGKLDAAYQAVAPRAEVTFRASTPRCGSPTRFLRAALAGHCALEHTFHLPVAAIAESACAPISMLERLAGRKLA
jgi:hypothetical protein